MNSMRFMSWTLRTAMKKFIVFGSIDFVSACMMYNEYLQNITIQPRFCMKHTEHHGNIVNPYTPTDVISP